MRLGCRLKHGREHCLCELEARNWKLPRVWSSPCHGAACSKLCDMQYMSRVVDVVESTPALVSTKS